MSRTMDTLNSKYTNENVSEVYIPCEFSDKVMVFGARTLRDL